MHDDPERLLAALPERDDVTACPLRVPAPEGEILVRVSRLRSVQHVRIERIQPELGEAPEAEGAPAAQKAGAEGA